MSDVYQKCFYRIVWTKKRREAMVLPRSYRILRPCVKTHGYTAQTPNSTASRHSDPRVLSPAKRGFVAAGRLAVRFNAWFLRPCRRVQLLHIGALLGLALSPLPARPASAADLSVTLLSVTLLSAGPNALQVRGADGRPFAVRVTRATWVLERGAVSAPRDLTPGETLRMRLRHSGAGDVALLVCDAGTAAALDAHHHRALSGTVLAVNGAIWTVQPTGEDAPVPVLVSARTRFWVGELPALASAFGAGASVSVATRGLANGLLTAVSVSDSLPSSAGETSGDAPASRPVSLSGAVIESRPDLGLLVLQDAAGVMRTVAVDAATRFKSAGQAATLADILPGMRVRVRLGLGRDAAGNPIAASMSASAARPAREKARKKKDDAGAR